MRVAIIGAGAAGLTSARHVSAEGIDCDVLEMAPELGGIWVYTDDIEIDRYGFPVYSAMYKNLTTNLPKEVMSFPDFPIPEQERSYLSQSEILKFLNLYANNFKLRERIKFNRMVTEVRPIDDNKWQIKSIDKPTKEEIISFYDVVMVCNGHFNEPITLQLPGEENFKGKISHSRQFRSPEPFTNQKVLVIGAGPSGFDLVRHISTVAEHVVLSHHNKEAVDSKFTSNVSKKPDIRCINDCGEVEFIDDSSCSFDAIVNCTGYKYSFPFLHDTCGVTIDDNCIQPLYKHMIHIQKPSMCFIGLPSYVSAFQMFDLQSRFYCKYLTGEMLLPSSEEMRQDTEKDMQQRRAKGYPKKKAHLMGSHQGIYYEDLATTANITPIAPVIPKLWNESQFRFYCDFLNFREYKYKIVDNEHFVTV